MCVGGVCLNAESLFFITMRERHRLCERFLAIVKGLFFTLTPPDGLQLNGSDSSLGAFLSVIINTFQKLMERRNTLYENLV